MVDVKNVEEIFRLTKEIKQLEADKKVLTDALKQEMLSTNQTSIVHGNGKITLSESTKNTVKKNMKDKLLLFLKQKQITSCISLTPEIDKESLETEINMGNVTKKELEQFITFSNVLTMRVTV